jgi:hypothetical protein
MLEKILGIGPMVEDEKFPLLGKSDRRDGAIVSCPVLFHVHLQQGTNWEPFWCKNNAMAVGKDGEWHWKARKLKVDGCLRCDAVSEYRRLRGWTVHPDQKIDSTLGIS